MLIVAETERVAERRNVPSNLTVLRLLAATLLLVPTPPHDDGVVLLTASDPEYLRLELPADLQLAPEAFSRLVVFRDGVPLLDRGLRDERLSVSTAPSEERGYVEDAEVSADGRVAVIVSTSYRRTLTSGEAKTEAETELTWIDPEHPKGLWSVALEEGRWVKKAVPLSEKRGVAVSTCRDLDGPADLRYFGPDGAELLRVNEDESSLVDMVATNHGAFFAADLVFPTRPGVPDRGILVLDLLRGTRWTYTWSYGGEGEPVSWNLEETGILQVNIPGAVLRFDRNGKTLGSSRSR